MQLNTNNFELNSVLVFKLFVSINNKNVSDMYILEKW